MFNYYNRVLYYGWNVIIFVNISVTLLINNIWPTPLMWYILLIII